MPFLRGVLVGALLVSSSALAESATTIYSLADADDLRPNGVAVEASEFQGRAAVEVSMLNDLSGGDSNTLAIVEGTDFQDGVIEFDVASRVNPDSWFFVRWFARGFVGIAFRTDADLSRFECIYLRPTNGRAEDPERRMHAVQYFSYPDYDFRRFRDEAPGKYEAPADIGPDEWIRVKIVVSGSTARLFVNDAAEPTLVVEDLKHGPDLRGSLGLFVDAGTIAHFSNLRVTPVARQ